MEVLRMNGRRGGRESGLQNGAKVGAHRVVRIDRQDFGEQRFRLIPTSKTGGGLSEHEAGRVLLTHLEIVVEEKHRR